MRDAFRMPLAPQCLSALVPAFMFPFRRHAKSSIHVPLAGFIFIGLCGFVLLAAMNSSSNLLYMAFGALVGCMLVSLRLVVRNLRHISVERVVDRHLAAGEPATIAYRLSNQKLLFPVFDVRIREADFSGPIERVSDAYCFQVSAGRTSAVFATLLPTHRGTIELNDIWLTTSFPFGFLLRFIHLPAPATVLVYPRVGRLNRKLLMHARDQARHSAITFHSQGECDEFYGLREYRPGDSIRTIHWRRSARLGNLVVREMAASVNPELIVVLDLTAARFDDAVERAIELAAAVIAQALGDQFSVGLHVVGRRDVEPAPPATGRDQREHLMEMLATIDRSQLVATPDPLPRRMLKTSAQWVLVTLDPARLPAGLGGASMTTLNAAAPEAVEWVTFG
jgi:uncharacterized protein (DUF58 family)